MVFLMTPHERVLAQREAEGWLFLADTIRGLCHPDRVGLGRRLFALMADPVRAAVGCAAVVWLRVCRRRATHRARTAERRR